MGICNGCLPDSQKPEVTSNNRDMKKDVSFMLRTVDKPPIQRHILEAAKQPCNVEVELLNGKNDYKDPNLTDTTRTPANFITSIKSSDTVEVKITNGNPLFLHINEELGHIRKYIEESGGKSEISVNMCSCNRESFKLINTNTQTSSSTNGLNKNARSNCTFHLCTDKNYSEITVKKQVYNLIKMLEIAGGVNPSRRTVSSHDSVSKRARIVSVDMKDVESTSNDSNNDANSIINVNNNDSNSIINVNNNDTNGIENINNNIINDNNNIANIGSDNDLMSNITDHDCCVETSNVDVSVEEENNIINISNISKQRFS